MTMKRYTVTSPLTLSAGIVVGLSLAQAEPRVHALDKVSFDEKSKTGTYRVVTPVQFKPGEQISVDEASINKALVVSLDGDADAASKVADKKRTAAADKQLAEMKAKAEALDALQPELQKLRATQAAFDQLPADVQAAAHKAAADAASKGGK
jgi:hypothetical protein